MRGRRKSSFMHHTLSPASKKFVEKVAAAMNIPRTAVLNLLCLPQGDCEHLKPLVERVKREARVTLSEEFNYDTLVELLALVTGNDLVLAQVFHRLEARQQAHMTALLFAALDSDGDGALNAAELRSWHDACASYAAEESSKAGGKADEEEAAASAALAADVEATLRLFDSVDGAGKALTQAGFADFVASKAYLDSGRTVEEDCLVLRVDDEDEQEGLLEHLGFDSVDYGLEFLVLVAQGDPAAWDVSQDGSFFASRIYHDTRIVKAVAALAAGNTGVLMTMFPVLAEEMELDGDAAAAVLAVAMHDRRRLNGALQLIARRLGVDPRLLRSFAAGSYRQPAMIESALSALCEKRDVEPMLATTIVLAAQLDVDAWVRLCYPATQQHWGHVTTSIGSLFALVDLVASDAKLSQEPTEEMETALEEALGLAKFDCLNFSLLKAIIAAGRYDLECFNDVMSIVLQEPGEPAPPPEKLALLGALVDVFNKDPSRMMHSVPELDRVITRAVSWPRGVITTYFGAQSGFLDLMADGVSRLCAKYWPELWVEGMPELFIAIHQQNVLMHGHFHKHEPAALAMLSRIGFTSPTPQLAQLVLALIVGDDTAIFRHWPSQVGDNVLVLRELDKLAEWEDSELRHFHVLRDVLMQTRKDSKYDITVHTVEAVLELLGNGMHDISEGRHGVGLPMYTLASTCLDAEDLAMLDTLFYAASDAEHHVTDVLTGLPVVCKHVLGSHSSDALVQLVQGIVSLLQAHHDHKRTEKAVEHLAAVFHLEADFVNGLIALGSGNFAAVGPMAEHVGKWDDEFVKQVLQVVRGIAPVVEAAAAEAGEDGAAAAVLPAMSKEDIQNLTAEEVFKLFDADNSRTIDFDEFTQVMRFYGLEMTEQRVLEIFSEVDEDGSGILDMHEFEAAVGVLKKRMAGNVLHQLGLTTSVLALAFISSVLILLVLFLFIFLGIAGFTNAGTFGAVVNSVLPAGAGAGMGGKDDKEKEDKEGDGGGGGMAKKISDAVHKAMDVLSAKN
eukprot:PLAT7037.10.p1 GENE.PLAT7037.10~~PLAT7037.10.p1  ORF type:complete len:1023 (-),score=631.98 PLAT7037.10:190-3234(-)